MIRYCFDDESPLTIKAAKDADPQVLGEALAVISAANEGKLKPADVVAAASDPSNPLHQHMEWDDSVAASAYRLDQARSIIRAVRVVPVANDEPKRAFISIGDKGGRSYRTVGEVASSTDLQARLLAQLDRELIAMQTRYRSLGDICQGLKDIQEKVREKQKKAGKAVAA